MNLNRLIPLVAWLFLIPAATLLNSCQQKAPERAVYLIVSNQTDDDLGGVVSGIAIRPLLDSLGLQTPTDIVLFDEQGQQVITQLFDNGQQTLLLFECSVLANGESSYSVQKGTPRNEAILPIAYEIEKMRMIRQKADTLEEQLATTIWTEIPQKQHQIDSLMLQLDVTALGGYTCPNLVTANRNPWNYKEFRVLAEGALMCAYQLNYDSIFIMGDTLIEQRTLVMQSGSHLTIVRDNFKNVSLQDTLLHINQLGIALPSNATDSIKQNNELSYMAIMHRDSTTTGLYVPGQFHVTRLSENRLAAFATPYTADSILTYYTVSNSDRIPIELETIEKELQTIPNAPLTVRIMTRN